MEKYFYVIICFSDFDLELYDDWEGEQAIERQKEKKNSRIS